MQYFIGVARCGTAVFLYWYQVQCCELILHVAPQSTHPSESSLIPCSGPSALYHTSDTEEGGGVSVHAPQSMDALTLVPGKQP